MTDTFTIQQQGLEEVVSRIRSLPETAQDQILDDVAAYSVGVLRKEPPQKYITRQQAYGQTFFTEKQRRWFFWALHNKKISVPYKRTGKLSQSLSYTRTKAQVVFTYAMQGAQYVVGFLQSRHEKMVGWKRIVDHLNGDLSFRSSKFRQVVSGAVRKAIGKVRLG